MGKTERSSSVDSEQNRQYNKHNIISQTNIFLKMSGSRVPVTMRDFFFDDPFFNNSWEDFDKVRDAMFTESRDMWKKFDDDFRNMACMSNNIMLEHSGSGNQPEGITNNNENRSLMRQDSKSRWENGWMFPRRWMLPALNTDFPSNMDIFKDKDNEVIRVKEDDTKMEVSLDTSQYRPDELKVMVNDGVLTVEGKHEEKAEDGSKMVSRMFSRKYTLPPAAKSEEASLTYLLMEFLLSLHQRRTWPSNKSQKCTNSVFIFQQCLMMLFSFDFIFIGNTFMGHYKYLYVYITMILIY